MILPNTTHRVALPFFWRKLRDYSTRHLPDEKPVLSPPEPDPAMPAIGATTK